MEMDLLNADPIQESNMHKLKRLVQSPDSYFLDVRCPNCGHMSQLFSHSQTAVVCPKCGTVLCQPTGGKVKLTQGSQFRRKVD